MTLPPNLRVGCLKQTPPSSFVQSHEPVAANVCVQNTQRSPTSFGLVSFLHIRQSLIGMVVLKKDPSIWRSVKMASAVDVVPDKMRFRKYTFTRYLP